MSITSARGFTLLEIIVVLLVFSVMAAMAYGGLNSVLKTRVAIEASMARTADVQRAYQRLRVDFQNLRDRAARDGFGDVHAPFVLDRDGKLTLIRGGWRSPVPGGRPSLERVAYELKDEVLHRQSWRAVDLPQQAEPVDLPLLSGVREIRWRFLDAGNRWNEQWPLDDKGGGFGTRADQAPPLAVEITLDTKDLGELRLLFRTPVAGLGEGGGDGQTGNVRRLLTKEGLLSLETLGLAPSVPPPRTPSDTPQTPQSAPSDPEGANPGATPEDES